jgi:hypothetical protein
MDKKKPYVSGKWVVLYNILNEFGIPMNKYVSQSNLWQRSDRGT